MYQVVGAQNAPPIQICVGRPVRAREQRPYLQLYRELLRVCGMHGELVPRIAEVGHRRMGSHFRRGGGVSRGVAAYASLRAP